MWCGAGTGQFDIKQTSFKLNEIFNKPTNTPVAKWEQIAAAMFHNSCQSGDWRLTAD